MIIYDHKQEEKIIKKDRNDKISNLVAYCLMTAFGIGFLIYVLYVDDNDYLWASIAIVVAGIIFIWFGIKGVKSKKVSNNLRYQELIDLIENRNILKMIDLPFEDLDCINSAFHGSEIGYKVNEYVYFNLLIDETEYSFSYELFDAVYDYDKADIMFEEAAFSKVDEYENHSFTQDVTKERIIEEFIDFINSNMQIVKEIAALCVKYQDEEDFFNEEA